MKAFLLIAFCLSTLLMSCGIFGSDDSVIVYDITEINNIPIQEWAENNTLLEIDGLDWPEKIEVTNYVSGHKIEGRVKMHRLGWFPIEDRSTDGDVNFIIHVFGSTFNGLTFENNTLSNGNLEGIIYFIDERIDDGGRPYRAIN